MWEQDFRLSFARPRFEPDNFRLNEKLLIPFSEVARQQECSLAQLSLAWLLARGDHVIPIPGTKHIEYMRENIKAAVVELDEATVEVLDVMINENTVSGDRYDTLRMRTSDAEQDCITQ